jgi:hypothetical protein
MLSQLNISVPQGTQINLHIGNSGTPQGQPWANSVNSVFQGLQSQLGNVNIYGAGTQGQAPSTAQASGFSEIDNGPYAGWLQGGASSSGMPWEASYAMPQTSGYAEIANGPYASWLQGGTPSAPMGGGQIPGTGAAAGPGGGADSGEPVAPGQPGSENRTYREFADADDPSGGPAEHRDMVDQYGYVYTWDPDYGRYEACGQDDGQGDLDAYSDEEYDSINKLDQQTPLADQASAPTNPGSPPYPDSTMPNPYLPGGAMPNSYPPSSPMPDPYPAGSAALGPFPPGIHVMYSAHPRPDIDINVSETTPSIVNITIPGPGTHGQ